SSYSLVDLGPVDGLPTSYGGLAFLNPSTLLIGGEANSASGSFYTVEVTRGVDGHISGFGSTTALNFGAYNDGGVAYSPDGVLFYSRWPLNQIAQVKEGSTTDDKVTDL